MACRQRCLLLATAGPFSPCCLLLPGGTKPPARGRGHAAQPPAPPTLPAACQPPSHFCPSCTCPVSRLILGIGRRERCGSDPVCSTRSLLCFVGKGLQNVVTVCHRERPRELKSSALLSPHLQACFVLCVAFGDALGLQVWLTFCFCNIRSCLCKPGHGSPPHPHGRSGAPRIPLALEAEHTAG